MRHWQPSSITTDQRGSYPRAIHRLQCEGKLPADTKHQTCKYLNNIIEADHGALKRVIRRSMTVKRTTLAVVAMQVFRPTFLFEVGISQQLCPPLFVILGCDLSGRISAL
jgi:transposase-like protein